MIKRNFRKSQKSIYSLYLELKKRIKENVYGIVIRKIITKLNYTTSRNEKKIYIGRFDKRFSLIRHEIITDIVHN